MFGHHDDQQPDNEASDQALDNDANSETVHPDTTSNEWQHPGTPLDNQAKPSADDASSTSPSLTGTDDSDQDSQADSPSVGADPHDDQDAPVAVDNDLVDIKQQALGQLKPLVDHLDQSPEEKFRTTMMMIQASDDKSLVKAAYEAAKQITDEKIRAQALLDVINEINYFTQNLEK